MKKIYLLSAVLFIAVTTQAQDMLGIRNSNYAGVTGLDLNPSSIVDSRLMFDFNLLTLGASIDNNYLFIPKDSLKFLGISNIFDKIDDKGYMDDYQFNGSGKDLYAGITIQGPSVMVNFSGMHSIAVAFNIRVAANFHNINFAQAKFAYTDINFDPIETTPIYSHNPNVHSPYLSVNPTDPNFNFNAKDFEAHVLGWGEWGLTYGTYLHKKGRHALKGAVTFKYLQGLGGAYVENTDIDFFVHNTSNNPKKDTTMTVQVHNIDYARVAYDAYKGKKSYGDWVHGSGFGWNIGFAYEIRKKDANSYMYEMDGEMHEDEEVNKYDWRFGLSLIDMGSITFSDEAAGVYNINDKDPLYCDTCYTNVPGYNTQPGYASNYDWYHDHFDNNLDFDQSFSSLFYKGDIGHSRVGGSFTEELPSAYSLQVDYNVYKKFYANATIIQALKHGDHQVVRANMLSITPRYETRFFEASVPISYFNNHDTRVGIAFRLANVLIIGSDKIGSIFGLTDMYGMDLYASLKFSVFPSRPKDHDGDHVSDFKDKCPNVAGLWKFMGCPDKDNDGVQDSEDLCPDTPGLVELKGCPDRDGDGVPDKDDQCPDTKGLQQFAGCPDTDGDGIIDEKDDCPALAGLAIYNGCPDTDGDSIPDPKDECPTQKGLAVYNGCPDTDGDGLPDNKDDCPYDVGPVSNKGCPVKVQEAVKPVKVELTQEEQEVINTVFKNLEFETGKSVIKESSFESLDKLVDLLKKKSAFKLTIEGHTDNVGKPASNLTLSKNRAKSAMKYLTDHGIDAKRITTNGFGSKKPVASNKTAEGRAKNRRVEFTIVQ